MVVNLFAFAYCEHTDGWYSECAQEGGRPIRSSVILPLEGVKGLRCEEFETAVGRRGHCPCGSMERDDKKLQFSPAQAIRPRIEIT